MPIAQCRGLNIAGQPATINPHVKEAYEERDSSPAMSVWEKAVQCLQMAGVQPEAEIRIRKWW